MSPLHNYSVRSTTTASAQPLRALLKAYATLVAMTRTLSKTSRRAKRQPR
jgi:hypothetical protein